MSRERELVAALLKYIERFGLIAEARLIYLSENVETSDDACPELKGPEER